ncbi:hypothetical protein [Nocardioides insulae]|uniref:hypothetical protein n=1 Tax=Nocardioides insulae TaxID=394734 RepID=UPI00048CBEB7|nr:hypothetical protein [Nocardioides insulae]
MDRATLGTGAVRALAAVRLINGCLGLLAPGFLVRRTSADPDATSPYYAFRMFGVRTIVLGVDLLALTGEQGQRARTEAVVIHGADTAAALVGALRGEVPRRVGVMTVAISAVNTALAVAARRWAPR